MKKPPLQVLLAETRGFCAGVVRAVEIVERALDLYGPPIYVRNKIVHNKTVVTEFEEKGVVFVKDIGDVPVGAITIFSAHGVSRKVVNEAGERSLQVIDATCPLVTKVHSQAKRYSKKGYELIMIAHEGHPEVEGTVGQVDGRVHIVATVEEVEKLELANPDKLAYVTQTTLGVDDTRDVITALVNRFPNIVGPDVKDICYATQNRQTAVRAMAKQVDVILIIGAHYSSNSCRLREIGEACGADSYLVPDADGPGPGVAVGCPVGRDLCGCFGAGKTGAGTDRAARSDVRTYGQDFRRSQGRHPVQSSSQVVQGRGPCRIVGVDCVVSISERLSQRMFN